jgi:hypothetical protein
MFGGGLEQRLRQELSRRQHFAAILPMPSAVPPPDIGALMSGVRAVVAHAGALVDLHPLMKGGGPDKGGGLARLMPSRAPVQTGQDYFIVVADVALWVAWRTVPLDHYGELPRFVNPETWPGDPAQLATHGGHVEICDLGLVTRRPMSAQDAAFNRAVAVTAVSAAIVRMALPLGILWHPARSALPPKLFRDQLGRVLAGQAPLELWMRWFFLRGADGQRPGIITRGLAPFIGREVEVRPSTRPEAEAMALAFAAASHLIDRGGYIADGQIFSPTPGLSARVRVGESKARKGLAVYEMTLPNKP